MTDDAAQRPPDIPDAATESRKPGVSAVWVIPIVAALIGGWLVFKSATKENAVAEITFENASGLEAGKTAVKLRNVKVGVVNNVRFSNDLAMVIVSIELTGVKQERLTGTTRFWVVRPRVDIGGVSGLDTLLSGAYIELDPGQDGQPTTLFTGLEAPENYQLGNPGTTYTLSADELGSLSRGSSIKFRDIPVGEVTRYKLSDDHSHVEIEVFIHAPHDQYVKQSTRFWNISGLEVELNAKGVSLAMDSVASLIAGGITFSNSKDISDEDQAPGGTLFALHKTEQPAFDEAHTFGAPLKLYFEEGVSGLAAGAPVEFKGLRLGTVVNIGAEAVANKSDILTFAMIDIEPDHLPSNKPTKNLTHDERLKDVYLYIERMVANGMRAQLRTGNLLTGQSLVALDIFPTARKTPVRYIDGVPVLPTVPETLTGLIDQASRIMTQIEAIPLGKISDDLEETTENINSLVRSLNAAEGGMLGVQAAEAMDELGRAARAIRSMAEYLERHPEALVKGKSPE